jgi:hypothetical protein
MQSEIEFHLEKMLKTYTQGEYFEYLKAAKEKYISLTGKLDEDIQEYESRMNCFNDWYLFQYKNEQGKKLVEDYLKRNQLSEEFQESFLSIHHSLFQFEKITSKKQIVLYDFLTEKDVTLSPLQDKIGLVVDDLFIGRSLVFKEESYLLSGVCTIPNSIKSSLTKECKKIKKLNDYEVELKFLLGLENLKTKSMHYSHIEPSKIFVFN